MLVGNYTSLGCYNDTVSARALTGAGLYGSSTNNMTLQKCGVFCSKYAYFGVEYGQECYVSFPYSLLTTTTTTTSSSTIILHSPTRIFTLGTARLT